MYSTAVSDVNDKLTDLRCFLLFSAISMILLKKVVPILCHRGQKFSILYKYLAFTVHIAVK